MAGISRAYKRRNNMVANTGAPVLCLDAGSRISYPGSGTTWTDLSGNGSTGTLTNGPTYSSANGGSIVFDGANDIVSIGDVATLRTLLITITCFFKTNSTSAYQVFYTKSNGTTGFYGGLYSGKLFIQNDSGYTELGNVIPDLNWHYAALTYDGTQAKTYLDGILGQTKTLGPAIILTAPAYISTYNGTANPFNGNISSVNIYNRALSAAEISQNFNLLRGRYGI